MTGRWIIPTDTWVTLPQWAPMLAWLLEDAEERIQRATRRPPPPDLVDGLNALRVLAGSMPDVDLPQPSSTVDVATAAGMLGCSARWVREMIANGVLRADRPVGSRAWQIDADDVEALARLPLSDTSEP